MQFELQRLFILTQCQHSAQQNLHIRTTRAGAIIVPTHFVLIPNFECWHLYYFCFENAVPDNFVRNLIDDQFCSDKLDCVMGIRWTWVSVSSKTYFVVFSWSLIWDKRQNCWKVNAISTWTNRGVVQCIVAIIKLTQVQLETYHVLHELVQ